MNRDILKIKTWHRTHKKLLGFIDNRESATGEEIRTWIANCVVYFVEIKMTEKIIEYFLSGLEYKIKIHKKESVSFPRNVTSFPDEIEEKNSIGPFPFDERVKGYVLRDHNLSERSVDKTQMTQIKVAFNVAKNIIDNYEYDERIIPKTIMNEFDNEKNQNMLITLKSIQNFYEKGDKKGLMTSLVTATDLLLKLIPEVAKFKINKKLSTIYDDKVLQEKYALNKEVIWSLNNSRIIRNEDIHNPLEENNTTLLEAVGYAHMLVLLISSTMASGKLKW